MMSRIWMIILRFYHPSIIFNSHLLIMDTYSKRIEPYFTFIEEESHFKVICSTVDGSSKPMRADKLIIEKKGCVIYTKRKSSSLFLSKFTQFDFVNRTRVR